MGRGGVNTWRKQIQPKMTLDHGQLLRNQAWVTDHRELDFPVYDPVTGEIFRAWVTVFIDCASRVPVGLALARTPSSQSILRAFADGIMPAADKPYAGLPVTVYEDNGQDYRPHVVTGVMRELVVRLINGQVEAPWAKGIVESWFRLMSMDFDRWQPGWQGNKPETRPEDHDVKQLRAEGKLLSLPQAEAALRDWCRRYATEHQHTGEGNGKTPLERYMELPAARTGLPSAKALSLLMLEEATARLYASGLKRFGRWFWHEALADPARPLIGHNVQIRFDRARPSQLFVFHDGEFVCTAVDKPKSAD